MMNRRKFLRESFLAATASLLAAKFAPAQVGVKPKRILPKSGLRVTDEIKNR